MPLHQRPPRDPARIDLLLAEVRRIWLRDTDLRLTQLLINAIRPKEPCPQIYSFEDDRLLTALRNYPLPPEDDDSDKATDDVP